MARRLRLIASLALFALGACIFLYPSLSSWLSQREAYQVIDSALRASGDGAPTVTDAPAAPADAAGRVLRPKDGDPAYAYLTDYNAQVADGTAGPINDPWGAGSDKDALSDVGLPDGLLGSVTVPKLGVTLPLYLGSTAENMARGATVVAGTSAPLGQPDSNCVIAAHRSRQTGLVMFRDIESLQPGDEVSLETPWDTLSYRVAETRIVWPDDTEAVTVQPGRDLVTLLTCHPYGYTSQRYLVTCERAADEGVTHEGEGLFATLTRPLTDVFEASDSDLLVAERWLRVVGFVLMAGMAVWGARALASFSKKQRPQHIRRS